MEAKLVVVGGEAKAAEIRLKLPTVIGRGREASLMVPHPLVSRRHCEIYEQDGQLVVRDLGSLNGTYVNNLKVTGEAILPPGQLLTIGAVTFRAMYESAASPAIGGEPGGRVSALSETVYAGEGRPPGDKSRQGTTKRMKGAPAAEATVDQGDLSRDIQGKSAAAAGEVELAEELGLAEDSAGVSPVEALATEQEPQRSPDDSDDALNDFLRNLK